MVDITNTDSPRVVSGGLIYEETLPTIVSPGDVDFSGVFGPDDASQILLQEAQDQGSLNVWTITLPNSRGFWTFSAYVSEIPMDVQYDKEVTFAGKLSISGPCIYTAGSSVSPRDRRAGSSDWFRLPLTVSNPPPTGFIRGTCFTNSILLEVLCLPLRKQCWMRRICPSVTIALGKKEYRLAFSMGSVIAHVNLGLSKKDFLAMSPKEFHALTKCYWERIGHLSPRISRPAGRCSLTKGGVLQLSPGGTKPFDFAQVQVWSDR